jgi:hypothetical protein
MRVRFVRAASTSTMQIDVKHFLDVLPAIHTPGVRIGYPDDPTLIDIKEHQLFAACLNDALVAFRDIKKCDDYVVDAEVNSYIRAVWIRFIQLDSSRVSDAFHVVNGRWEPEVAAAFDALSAAMVRNNGTLHYWGGNNYFDLSIPYSGPMRENIPEVEHLPWDDRYRYLLQHADWGYLRQMVFRFSSLAEVIAARCVDFGLSRVLIPSVGLCVDPWIFANRGLSVVATETAESALTAVSDPIRWPRLYSPAAKERWDVAASSAYASQGNPDSFEELPDLANDEIVAGLRHRIQFAVADWEALPIEAGSIDAIFATNALPRDSNDEQLRVLKEWIRVVRPGGAAFIAQHNFRESNVEQTLRDAGWMHVDLLNGERRPPGTVFQMYLSSG